VRLWCVCQGDLVVSEWLQCCEFSRGLGREIPRPVPNSGQESRNGGVFPYLRERRVPQPVRRPAVRRATDLVASAESLISNSNGPVTSSVLRVGVTREASSVHVLSGKGPAFFALLDFRAVLTAGSLHGIAQLGRRQSGVSFELVALLVAVLLARVVTAVLLRSKVPGGCAKGRWLHRGLLGDILKNLAGERVLLAEVIGSVVDELLFDGHGVSDHTVAVGSVSANTRVLLSPALSPRIPVPRLSHGVTGLEQAPVLAQVEHSVRLSRLDSDVDVAAGVISAVSRVRDSPLHLLGVGSFTVVGAIAIKHLLVQILGLEVRVAVVLFGEAECPGVGTEHVEVVGVTELQSSSDLVRIPKSVTAI